MRPLVGASAAVAALMGAAFVWFPDSPVVVAVLPFALREVGLKWFVGIWLAFQVLLTQVDDVALLAHMVGALTGALLGLGLKWAGLVEQRAFDPRVSPGHF